MSAPGTLRACRRTEVPGLPSLCGERPQGGHQRFGERRGGGGSWPEKGALPATRAGLTPLHTFRSGCSGHQAQVPVSGPGRGQLVGDAGRAGGAVNPLASRRLCDKHRGGPPRLAGCGFAHVGERPEPSVFPRLDQLLLRWACRRGVRARGWGAARRVPARPGRRAGPLHAEGCPRGYLGSRLGTLVFAPHRAQPVSQSGFGTPPTGLGGVAAHDRDRSGTWPWAPRGHKWPRGLCVGSSVTTHSGPAGRGDGTVLSPRRGAEIGGGGVGSQCLLLTRAWVSHLLH